LEGKGKAYNPKMFDLESNAHERFNSLPREAIDALRKVTSDGKAKAGCPQKWTYDQLWEMHKAGRSGEVGHFIFEMF